MNKLGLKKLKTKIMLNAEDEKFIDEVLSRRSGSSKDDYLYEGGEKEK